ncbi:hypothetical protein BKA70DRAFT_1352802 [Coprinopsis sp. MPI-PUGE-AT-0042]|nr:hypothetical protein BKA70DRAFT_1352802 [Coprinopsis sp. MPI-PUGE-AT-0042]
MTSEPQLDFYVNYSNDPLPYHLHQPLHAYLDQLDAQQDIYERDKRRLVEGIDSRQAQIDALQWEIDSLVRVKSQLIDGQSVLEAKKRRYASSVTAIRRIPPEIIARIIQFAVGTPDGLMHREERLVFAQLRSVSRLWRETSFSTPRLWRAVGLDIDQIVASDPLVDIKEYVCNNLTPWFHRAGDAAPVTLQVYRGLPATIPHILDFASKTGLNITSLAFSTPENMQSYAIVPYHALKTLSTFAGSPFPVKYLTFEFLHHQFQASPDDVADLTQNFPDLARLTLIEYVSPPFMFSLKIVHDNLVSLHLTKLVLPSTEMDTILSGLPRLRVLHLDQCQGQITRWGLYSPYNHQSLDTLILTYTFPEDCLGGLTCPALTSIIINGPPPDIPRNFHLSGKWPKQLLKNILDGHTALSSLSVEFFSAFNAFYDDESRCIKIPSSLSTIRIVQAATEPQLVEFCDSIVLEDGCDLVVNVPNCASWTAANFPWPRPASGQSYILCHMADDVEHIRRVRDALYSS